MGMPRALLNLMTAKASDRSACRHIGQADVEDPRGPGNEERQQAEDHRQRKVDAGEHPLARPRPLGIAPGGRSPGGAADRGPEQQPREDHPGKRAPEERAGQEWAGERQCVHAIPLRLSVLTVFAAADELAQQRARRDDAFVLSSPGAARRATARVRARSCASWASGSAAHSVISGRQVLPDAGLHDRQLVGQKAVDQGVSASQLGHNIAQLRAADQMPVAQRRAGRIVPELHVAHDPAQQADVSPPDEAAVGPLDLGEGLDVEAELHLLGQGACHVGEQAVQRVDQQHLALAEGQRGPRPLPACRS